MILFGAKLIEAESKKDAVKKVQALLNENVNNISFDFQEATADYAEESEFASMDEVNECWR